MPDKSIAQFEMSGPVTPEAVVWAYRYLLGREPESEAIINDCLLLPSVTVLRDNIMQSLEFQSIATHSALAGIANPVVRCAQPNGLVLYVDLRDRYVSMGCLMGRYEPAETQFILSRLSPGDGFIDIGANIGWFTCHAARGVGPRGRVWAFEPRTEAFNMLKSSIRDNRFNDRVSLLKCGLVDEKKQGNLRWEATRLNQGGATLSNAVAEVGHASETVELDKLDNFSFDRPVKLIKIDVEGSEYLAVKGGLKTIREHRPTIISEICPTMLAGASQATAEDYIALLESLGYIAYVLSRDGLKRIENITNFLASLTITNVVFEPK